MIECPQFTPPRCAATLAAAQLFGAVLLMPMHYFEKAGRVSWPSCARPLSGLARLAVSALLLISPGTYSPTSPVSVEASRGSKFTFWLVNNGADFTWWAAEKIAPSVLIRFIGVRPELVAASPKVEQDRVMNIVSAIEPLSLRFPGINVDSTPDLQELPLEKITRPDADHLGAGRPVQHIAGG